MRLLRLMNEFQLFELFHNVFEFRRTKPRIEFHTLTSGFARYGLLRVVRKERWVASS
jgi:hypothetical protein